MLQIRGITKTYGDEIRALNDVDLSIARGDIVCLLGPSGCGKTTLLRIIAGLESPDSGEIIWNSKNLVDQPVHRRNFGYMFQDFALFPHKNVAENVAFGLRMQKLPRDQVTRRVQDMLLLVGLGGYGNRSVFELSGGERQRVALARSLAPDPELIMLDEPLGSLDRTLRENLTGELRTILKQVDVTAIYVTHDQEEAFAIADQIAVMDAGNIIQVDSPERVYRRPISAQVARFLGFTSLLPVQPVRQQRDLLDTTIGQIPASILPHPIPPSGGLLLIRPDSARITRDGNPCSLSKAGNVSSHDPPLHVVEAERKGAGESRNLRLDAVLVECSYRGSQYRLTIEVRSSEGPVQLIFDLPAFQFDPATGRLQEMNLPEIGLPISLTIFPELISVIELSSD